MARTEFPTPPAHVAMHCVAMDPAAMRCTAARLVRMPAAA